MDRTKCHAVRLLEIDVFQRSYFATYVATLVEKSNVSFLANLFAAAIGLFMYKILRPRKRNVIIKIYPGYRCRHSKGLANIKIIKPHVARGYRLAFIPTYNRSFLHVIL